MDELEALIRQAELQQQQLKLELQFQRNMELFKLHAPVIHEEYFNYTPHELQLSFSPEGFVNLINSKTGAPVYRKNPAEFCKDQVEAWAGGPYWFKVGFNPPRNDLFFQNKILGDLVDSFEDELKGLHGDTRHPAGVLMITGCGLGYHIPEILRKMEVFTLCIFDPHKDSFYASLHTLDWEPIINYIARPGRLLKLFIGGENDKTITSLRQLTHKIGLHNIANTYIYRHLESEKADSFIVQLRKQFHLTLTGTGFLEDEQISIAHTVENLNRNTPVMNSNPPLEDLPPVFIVGNGPSLDEQLDLLRTQGDRAIVISCGSTIGTLFKADITPDFHIEMERTDETTEVLKELCDEAFKARIPILALNTVHPEALAFFERSAIAIKVNDPGEHIIETNTHFTPHRLNASNPTCTNTGLAFALQFGFKEIYLLGVDLGMTDEHSHHAASSQYFDNSSKVLNSSPVRNAPLTVPGNFGGTVKTDPVLDTSRANMEFTLRQHPHVKVYNLNNGALIKGTEPLETQKVSLSSQVDKKAIVDQLLSHFFTQPNLAGPMSQNEIERRYLNPALNFIDNLDFSAQPKTMLDVQSTLDQIVADIEAMRDTDPVSFWLLTGSTQNFFTLIHRACLAAETPETLQANYKKATTAFTEFLARARHMLKKEPLKLHRVPEGYTTSA